MPEQPQIIISGDLGVSHKEFEKTRLRLQKGKQYKDLSTVCVVLSRGMMPTRVVDSWMNLMIPMNNRFIRLMFIGMEVGDAYEKAVEMILGHPVLRDFKYLLTMEDDNMPPPDGLTKLLETICDCKKPCTDHFTQVAGLYYTKGDLGQPMIYGDPKAILAFQPQVPLPEKVQECNGTGMGFTLFHLGLFKDKRVERPWFKTIQEYSASGGVAVGTQDLYLMGKLRRLGYRIASDNRVRVGHFDFDSGIVY